MLDFGWTELILIVAIAIIVIGPDEIPALMVGLGRVFRRFQYIKFAVSRQFDDLMHDADLDNIRNTVNFEAQESSVDETNADAEIAVMADAAEAARKAENKAGEGDKNDA
ncbi:MAG: twin-arginine translocase TatA/TatE family subunit [Alphaproteobacteria bacterium]